MSLQDLLLLKKRLESINTVLQFYASKNVKKKKTLLIVTFDLFYNITETLT